MKLGSGGKSEKKKTNPKKTPENSMTKAPGNQIFFIWFLISGKEKKK